MTSSSTPPTLICCIAVVESLLSPAPRTKVLLLSLLFRCVETSMDIAATLVFSTKDETLPSPGERRRCKDLECCCGSFSSELNGASVSFHFVVARARFRRRRRSLRSGGCVVAEWPNRSPSKVKLTTSTKSRHDLPMSRFSV